MIKFAYPIVLFNAAEKVLKEIGPEKFFSSPAQEIQKVREGFIEFFFVLGLKKATGKDWLVMHPEEFPDFSLMTINGEPLTMTLDSFELVEIPPRCASFEQMLEIVNRKKSKGYPKGYNLLIFVNNEKSEEWTKLLNDNLKNSDPFVSIWTIHLMMINNMSEIYSAVINRIFQKPNKHILLSMEEKGIFEVQPVQEFMEEYEEDGQIYRRIKSEIMQKLLFKMKRELLNRNKGI